MNLEFNTNLFGDLEFISLAKVTAALAEIPRDYRDVEFSGFNDHTGNVFIVLECGVTICSAFGHDVSYLAFDSSYEDRQDEVEFATFKTALAYAEIELQ